MPSAFRLDVGVHGVRWADEYISLGRRRVGKTQNRVKKVSAPHENNPGTSEDKQGTEMTQATKKGSAPVELTPLS